MPLKLIPPRAGKSKNWSIRGTYLSVAVNQSAGTADRKIAIKEQRLIERAIEDGRFAKPSEKTFADIAVLYLQLEHDTRFIKKLLLHFKETPVSQITQEAINNAAVTLYPDATPATRNRQVYTPISAILRNAKVTTVITRPKHNEGNRRNLWLKPEDAVSFFACAREVDPEFEVFLILLLYTGLRLSEALGIEQRNVFLEENYLYIPDTKNGDPRAVHLPAVVVEALKSIPSRTRMFNFYKSKKLYGLLRRTNENFRKKRVGEGVAAEQIPVVIFHTLRHTYGTWMTRYGKLDTRGLVATGAWKSPASAARYQHSDATEEARRADLLPIAAAPRTKI